MEREHGKVYRRVSIEVGSDILIISKIDYVIKRVVSFLSSVALKF